MLIKNDNNERQDGFYMYEFLFEQYFHINNNISVHILESFVVITAFNFHKVDR